MGPYHVSRISVFSSPLLRRHYYVAACLAFLFRVVPMACLFLLPCLTRHMVATPCDDMCHALRYFSWHGMIPGTFDGALRYVDVAWF